MSERKWYFFIRCVFIFDEILFTMKLFVGFRTFGSLLVYFILVFYCWQNIRRKHIHIIINYEIE